MNWKFIFLSNTEESCKVQRSKMKAQISKNKVYLNQRSRFKEQNAKIDKILE